MSHPLYEDIVEKSQEDITKMNWITISSVLWALLYLSPQTRPDI